jgi:hypothetical protein
MPRLGRSLRAAGAVGADAVSDRPPLRAERGRSELEEVLVTVTGQATAFGVVGVVTILFAASGGWRPCATD